MSVTCYPPSRLMGSGTETLVLPLSWGDMREAAENPLIAATYPGIPTYDTAANLLFALQLRTNTGSHTNLWWLVVVLPRTYLAATDLTLKIDGLYVLGGDGVKVASTIDVEAFPYDSVNGDFSNADICATAATTLTNAVSTLSFTLTGATLTPLTPILIRFTSVINITSAGGAGTGQNSINFPRIEFSGRE